MWNPVWRHVVTCIRCLFREGTPAGHAYPERCPYCGGPLEHYETTIQTQDELAELNITPPRRRLAATVA